MACNIGTMPLQTEIEKLHLTTNLKFKTSMIVLRMGNNMRRINNRNIKSL
jgi:hypothetical protein